MNHLLAKHHAAKATICSINLMYLRRRASKHSLGSDSMLMQQSNHKKHLKSYEIFWDDETRFRKFLEDTFLKDEM